MHGKSGLHSLIQESRSCSIVPRFSVPGSEAVDAFSVSWTGENNWLVPPVHCVIRVVQHLLVCSAVGT